MIKKEGNKKEKLDTEKEKKRRNLKQVWKTKRKDKKEFGKFKAAVRKKIQLKEVISLLNLPHLSQTSDL